MNDSNSTYAEEIRKTFRIYNSSNKIVIRFMTLEIMNLITLVIGLLVVCLALYIIYRQFKVSRVASVYVINLLISDLIQFLGRSLLHFRIYYSWTIILSGMFSSLGFMVCIAMERYLLIAHPHWYRSHFTFKLSVVTSTVVWLISVVAIVFFKDLGFLAIFNFRVIIMLLIPLPLLLFFFVGTWRGLSKATTLSSREKKRILATLLVVIVNYSLLLLSIIIPSYYSSYTMLLWVCLTIFLSPLLDPLLYIFIRKDTKHIMEEFPCCRRSSRNEEQAVSSVVVSENIRSG